MQKSKWFHIVLLCFICTMACKEPPSEPAPSAMPENAQTNPAPTPPVERLGMEERIEIPIELQQQLAAAGYMQKDTAPKTVPSDNPYSNVDLAGLMEGTNGTFVFYDMQRDMRLVHNEARANTPFSPCSTFKIPHSLIALDTGVASGPGQPIAWDKQKYPEEPWWDSMLAQNGLHWDRDHSLATAFANSCVWYYKETAKKIGADRMKSYLIKFNYGNRDISSGIDSFWLGGSLKISANAQVDFLHRFLRNDLGLKKKTVIDARQVFEVKRVDNRVLYAKTGGGENIGWYVGFIETPDNQYLFAFNMPGVFKDTLHTRITKSMAILAELGVWVE
ncbi:MAG: class D beta-lactamase [Deltaproteobacteria bacterium]|nr:class D beta-lactamase [Deltaproteobacteria bacterium]MBN2672182.1 class D beta-lactamase [Deltaproteobacteria bacterium]